MIHEQASPDRYNCPVDGHAHLHSLSEVESTLEAAAAGFCHAGGRGPGLVGVLLLAQVAGNDVFESLQRHPAAGAWQLATASDEPGTVIARRQQVAVAIVCGRQLRTADGLELLALGTAGTFPDGLSLPDALAAVQRSGALAVLPWGFGKWLGERGRRVSAALASADPAVLFVGDNGSRLGWLGMPRGLRAAAQHGFRVLPGSDPFPFGRDYRRVGRFGFLAGIEADEAAPWRGLRQWILRQPASPPAYGTGSGPLRFLRNQLGIQVHKRLCQSGAM
ncbi:MAG: hypothetical protein EPO25_04880 [Gammaproteobacteria bacterium]|nr:MAG: hypothetical protein EPO25_04880 [Gammaproteobacteria bacterium]